MTSTPDNINDGVAQDPNDQSGAAAARGNPYRARLEQQSHDLDANAPVLKASDMRRLNRRAIFFLAALVVLLVVAAMWMFNNIKFSNSTPQKPKEKITVPEAPKPPPLQPQPQQRPQANTQPIPVVPAPPPFPDRAVAEPHIPSLVERRIMDSNAASAIGVNSGVMQPQSPMFGGIPGMGASAPGGSDVPAEFALPSNSAYKAKALDKTASAEPLIHPDTVMTRGTYIRCVLETHVVTDVPGFTSCIVTEPVYSFTGKRLLLPKGSKVLGKYDTESNSDRVAVIWDRILTPNGIDVSMASPGIDTLGGAGLPGYRDAHWGERIRAALLISMLSDAFSYEAMKHAPANSTTTQVTGATTTFQPWQSNTAQTLQNFAGQAVRRSANRPDTIVINQGTVIYVYVAKDIDFTAVLARS